MSASARVAVSDDGELPPIPIGHVAVGGGYGEAVRLDVYVEKVAGLPQLQGMSVAITPVQATRLIMGLADALSRRI